MLKKTGLKAKKKWGVTLIYASGIFLIFTCCATQILQAQQPAGAAPADVPQSLWNEDEEFRWMYERYQDLVRRTARLPTPGTEDFRNYRANITERDNLARNIRNLIQGRYIEEMQKKADEIQRHRDRLQELTARETAITTELKNPRTLANRRQELQNELAALQRNKQQAQTNLNTATTQYNNLFQSFLRRGGDRKWTPRTQTGMTQPSDGTTYVSYPAAQEDVGRCYDEVIQYNKKLYEDYLAGKPVQKDRRCPPCSLSATTATA